MSTTRVQCKGLHHVAYTTRDIEATLDFYTTKLGMPLIHAENHLHGDGYFRHFFFGLGNGEAIAFFALKDCGEEEGYKTAISTGLGLPNWANHIAFKLDTLEELEAKTAEIKANGHEEILMIDHGWCTSIYLDDPNGIMVEYCVTTDPANFAQSEEEALRLLRLPVSEIGEASRKDAGTATVA